MEKVLAASPHIHSNWSTRKIMWFVTAALTPAIVSSVIFFGFYQLLVIACSVFFCTGTEAVIQSLRKKKITAGDGSSVLTGILLALTLPPGFSLTYTAIGAAAAIGFGKQVFGGLGYNIFNPALVGRAFLQAAFPVAITTWTKPAFAVDAVTSATPLALFKFDKIFTPLPGLLIGNTGGSLGETSAIAILTGGIFLIILKIVNWRIPVSMILTMLLLGGIFKMIDPSGSPDPLFHIFAGGFMIGAFFMATDWVTSPITNRGMLIYGSLISLLIFLIRIYGGLPEGVMYSILIMNGFVPLINRGTRPRIFGLAKGGT